MQGILHFLAGRATVIYAGRLVAFAMSALLRVPAMLVAIMPWGAREFQFFAQLAPELAITA